LKNRHLTDETDILVAVHRGRYMVKELEGVIRLKKYRYLKQTYGSEQGAEDSIRQFEDKVRTMTS